MIILGFGLDRNNLSRNPYGWREYLGNNGITLSNTRDRYFSLGNLIDMSISNLSNYNSIYIKGEVIF